MQNNSWLVTSNTYRNKYITKCVITHKAATVMKNSQLGSINSRGEEIVTHKSIQMQCIAHLSRREMKVLNFML